MKHKYFNLASTLLIVLSAFRADAADNTWTLAVIGDQQFAVTQTQGKNWLDRFTSQTEWLAANAKATNLRMVVQVGDIVERSTVKSEWDRGLAGMQVLDQAPDADGGTGIPWSVAYGNHEIIGAALNPKTDPAGAEPSATYRQYFGSASGTHRYANQPEFKGVSKNDLNTWHIIKSSNAADARSYLMLNLEIDVPGKKEGTNFDAIEWAQGIMDDHRGMPTIITTHVFEGHKHAPPKRAYLQGFGHNSQLEIFDKLVKNNPQVFMVLSGHTSEDTHQIRRNAKGQPVLQMVTDYNKWVGEGGDGYFRLIEIDEQAGEIRVATYSALLDKHRTDGKSRFAVPLDFNDRFPRVKNPAAARLAPDKGAKRSAGTTQSKVRIVLAGDSTVTDEAGWGKGFSNCLADHVECINLAKGGASSKSYIDAGRWKKCRNLHPAYLLIQFGHNDQPGKGPDRETIPQTTYRQNLIKIIDEARKSGIRPILVTSLSRRQWNKQGKIESNLLPYVDAVKQVAAEKQLLCIDLHARSIELYEKLGKEGCLAISPQSETGYDGTHLNPHGSEVIGSLVAAELMNADLSLVPLFKSALSKNSASAVGQRNADSAASAIKVAAISFVPTKFDLQHNMQELERAFREAKQGGAQIAVAPEGCLEGYVVNDIIAGTAPADKMKAVAVSIDGPEIQHFQKLAAALDMCLVFGFAEKIGGDVFNASVFIDNQGNICGKHHKMQLAEGYDPSWWFNRLGEQCRAFDTPYGRCGLLICNERWNPALSRILTLDGAQFLLISANGSRKPTQDEAVLNRARESRVPVVEANVGVTMVVDDGNITSIDRDEDQITFGNIHPAPFSDADPIEVAKLEKEFFEWRDKEMRTKLKRTLEKTADEQKKLNRAR